MAVHASDIVPGEFFMAVDGRLRKVCRNATDAGVRVRYQGKPVGLPPQPLLFGHGQHDVPLLEDFARQCVGRINPRQLDELRRSGILLEHE